MRIFDREPYETTKAFEAWTIYRELGAQRSLKKTAELYYGRTSNVRQLQRWSSRFNWVERARACDVEREMLRRSADEEYLATQAEDHAEREGRIAEILLTVREEAAKQALSIVRWPLSEQRILQEDEDGNEITVILMPAKWSMNTALGMARLVAGAVPGLAPCARTPMRPTPGGTSPRSFNTLYLFCELRHYGVLGSCASPSNHSHWAR